jgi:hypothetical protein
MPSLSKGSKSLLLLLVLLAASEFVVRGPLRFLRAADFNDFISPYTQSRALIMGMDPYSPEVLVRLWPVEGAHRPEFLAKDLADGSLIMKRGIPTAYPLTCLFLLIPLAVLPWPAASFRLVGHHCVSDFRGDLVASFVADWGWGWVRIRTTGALMFLWLSRLPLRLCTLDLRRAAS